MHPTLADRLQIKRELEKTPELVDLNDDQYVKKCADKMLDVVRHWGGAVGLVDEARLSSSEGATLRPPLRQRPKPKPDTHTNPLPLQTRHACRVRRSSTC